MDNIFLINGIKVHLISSSSKIITTRIVFKGGSGLDIPGYEGTTHLLEHLLVRNIELKNSSYGLEKEGLEVNGTTTISLMQVELETIEKMIERTMNDIIKLFNNFKFTNQDFKTEKHAVMSELTESSDDSFIERKIERTVTNTKFINEDFIKRDETLKSIKRISQKLIYKRFNDIKQKGKVMFIFSGRDIEKFKDLILDSVSNIKIKEGIKIPKKKLSNIEIKDDFSKRKYRYGLLTIKTLNPSYKDYINFKILQELWIYWSNAKIDTYTREVLKASYSTKIFEFFTSNELIQVYYFKISKSKLLLKAMKQINLDFLSSTKAEFNSARAKAFTTYYKMSDSDKADILGEMNTLFSFPTKNKEYYSLLKNAKYSDFIDWYRNLYIYKRTI